MNIFIRYPDQPEATYYARWTAAGGKRFLRNTFKTTKSDAEKALRQLAGAAEGHRFDALDATKARHVAGITLGQLIGHYRTAARRTAARQLDHHTIRTNVNSLRLVIRRALGLDAASNVDATTLDTLTGDLVYRFRQSVLEAAATTSANDVRADQMQRTANSQLRQARSLFTKDMLNNYHRGYGLDLPANLRGFTDEPGFKVAAKSDYNKPSDQIITRTFTDLPALEKTDLNLYLAIWAALGFGLRRDEIAAARVAWFIQRDGATFLRGDVIDKAGKIPDIICQLGADAKLQPHLDGRPGADHLLTGSDTERKERVFRRCAAWMRARGWATQKVIHEFRAFAICQVAMGTGNLIEAQKWARHGSYTTTEKNYGRYITGGRSQVPLSLPTPTLVAIVQPARATA